MTAAYDPHRDWRREPLLTAAELTALCAEVNAEIRAAAALAASGDSAERTAISLRWDNR